jgi:hypothetical protein
MGLLVLWRKCGFALLKVVLQGGSKVYCHRRVLYLTPLGSHFREKGGKEEEGKN